MASSRKRMERTPHDRTSGHHLSDDGWDAAAGTSRSQAEDKATNRIPPEKHGGADYDHDDSEEDREDDSRHKKTDHGVIFTGFMKGSEVQSIPKFIPVSKAAFQQAEMRWGPKFDLTGSSQSTLLPDIPSGHQS